MADKYQTTEFLLKNIHETYHVYQSILKFEQDILEAFDKGVRKSFNEFTKKNWIITKDELQDDYSIYIIRESWTFKSSKQDIDSYIWTFLYLEGDDPIWRFFGLPDNDNSVYICLEFSEIFKQLPNNTELIEKFDTLNQDKLLNAGFEKKGGNVNRYYKMDINFSKESILKGLLNEDWDDATIQLFKAWKVFDELEWSFLEDIIKNKGKS